jgi:PAS domain S-box-containing protein
MRELSDAQSYARGLIEACLDLMVTIDRAGVVTDANRAAGEMTGLPLDRLIGQPFAALCGDPERAAEGVARTFAEGAVRGYELSLLTASGRALPTVFNASLYRDTAGEVQGVLATARPRD